jgi:hypothetical protein
VIDIGGVDGLTKIPIPWTTSVISKIVSCVAPNWKSCIGIIILFPQVNDNHHDLFRLDLYNKGKRGLTPVFESIDIICQSKLRATRTFERVAVSIGKNFAFALFCCAERAFSDIVEVFYFCLIVD